MNTSRCCRTTESYTYFAVFSSREREIRKKRWRLSCLLLKRLMMMMVNIPSLLPFFAISSQSNLFIVAIAKKKKKARRSPFKGTRVALQFSVNSRLQAFVWCYFVHEYSIMMLKWSNVVLVFLRFILHFYFTCGNSDHHSSTAHS